MMRHQRPSEILQRLFDTRAPALFIVGSIVLGVMGNGVYDLLTDLLGNTPLGHALLGGSALLIFIVIILGAWLWLRTQSPAMVTVPEERRADPHVGLVLLVSAQPQGAESHAIATHIGTLRYCWLIVTPEVASDKLDALRDQLRIGRAQAIPVTLQNAYDAREAYDLVADILARAEQRRGTYPIIVDITGGTKPMTAGAVLACRNHGVSMQYMQTHFVNGRPDPSAQPQAIKVELHELV